MSDTTNSISLHVASSVNAYCSCGFTIQNGLIYCSDEKSITLRGYVDKTLVEYLQAWISKTAVINVLGVSLAVDQSCPIQISSVDAVGCPTTTSATTSNTNSADQAKLANAVGAAAGATAGSIIAVVCLVVIIIVLVFVLLRRRKRNPYVPHVYFDNKLAHTTMHACWDCGEVIVILVFWLWNVRSHN